MIVRRDKLGLDAVNAPSDLDIAWAAGIYEGEGSCVSSGSDSFTVSIAQKDPELLYRLRDFFGGSVKLYCVGKDGRFPIFHWRVCGDRGRVFLAAIYPFLTSRRKAQIATTTAKRFLDYVGCAQGNSAPSETTTILWERMNNYTALHRRRAFETRNEYQRDLYQKRKANLEFMEKRRANVRAWRRKQKSNDFEKVVAIS